MSEENTGVQEPQANESSESTEVDLQKVLEEKQNEIENLKKIAQGQDKKNSELFKEIESLKNVLNEKEQTKKTVEQQIEELTKQLQERDQREKLNEKKAMVHKVIAENKLDPEFDFDALFKFETEDLIKEKAQQRAEYYKKLKEDGFKERATGSIPKKGDAVAKDLSEMSLDELNRLAIEKPELKAQIIEAVKNRRK